MPEIVSLDMPASYWRGKAQRAQRSGDLPEAARLYRAALRKQDSNGVRRELAGVYADMGCFGASDRLYLENLARDAQDSDSLFGLARSRSLAGSRQEMAELLDLYLRLAPCGEQADQARDILWQLPRTPRTPKRRRRAETLYLQAADHEDDPKECLRRAKRSWRRGHTAEAAQLICRMYLQQAAWQKALDYAKAACDLAPQDLECRLLLAAALDRCKLPRAAESAYRQAMLLCTEPAQVPLFCRYTIGLGHAPLAAALLEQELEKKPTSADWMILLAIAMRADGADEERAEELLRRAAAIDEEDPVPHALLEMPAGSESDPAAQLQQSLRFLQRLGSAQKDGLDLHGEITALMRLPVPGMTELAVQLFMQTEDALGLRIALLQGGLPPVQYALILSTLQAWGASMPCFARVEGKMCLLPQRRRPPYDGDLHALVRRLLYRLRGSVPLDVMVREIAPAWRSLTETARRRCVQQRNDGWTAAFAAYLTLQTGDGNAARQCLQASRHPKAAARDYRRLLNRKESTREVH